MPEPLKAFAAEPYSYAAVRAVADDLDLSEPVAVTLVRRGYDTPEQARAFLEADESHPPAAFAGMEDAVEQILATITAEERITVHGDFDVDGVCATALVVSALRGLGADCDWLIPDRMADGYGLSSANVEKLAERGTSLLLTVDCGITAVEEVRLAQELGMDVIITDHHQAAEQLPECLILHPEISSYPFVSLCGTAVAWKLACALRGDVDADLDLVALATVADVVPLVGENRALVRKGLAEIRRCRRPGLKALIESAKCEPTRLDESDLGFRLAPRINAAGRLYRADAGVELLLTDDAARAEQIANELGRANSERRATEREVDNAAETARRELSEQLLAAPALVVAGEGWHPGVVGIVASRLVERHHRPTIVISLNEDGEGRGSGRSISGFDLLAGLEACSEHLEGFGGHRAAAGLTIKAENLEAFREAFAAHASSVLSPEDLLRTERVDAMVGGAGIGLDLAEELGRLAPFGMGNPGVRLMVPAAKVSDVRTMGEGKHARFSLHSGSHRALGVAFGRSSLGVGDGEPVDASVRLEVNHWKGSVEPRLVLRELYPLEGKEDDAPVVAHACECDDAEWWTRFEAELERDLGALGGSSLLPIGEQSRPGSPEQRSRTIVTNGGSAIARIAELVSSGAGVLAVCADASRRAQLAGGAAGLARFNGGGARIACSRCGMAARQGLEAKASGGLALVDYPTLELSSGSVAESFEHVILVDPPPSAAAAAIGGEGFLHELWTEAELEFALGVATSRAPSREVIASVYRSLRTAPEHTGAGLRAGLSGDGAHPMAPEIAARSFRVLRELGLVRGEPGSGAGAVGSVSSERTDLERSAAFRAYSEEFSEAQRFLERPNQP
ncbi:MAG TPA: single-stranded-DNA-specific exonuclease RecJ [Solirubrobacterales bacterium]|nr:single-stranded-DNA-specific exonuclease RecJ [Solirubrobacterales bacterium]